MRGSTLLLNYAHLKLLLGVFVAGLLVVTAYLVLGGATRRMQDRRDRASPDHLRQATGLLLPWDPRQALHDLSSLYRGTSEYTALGGGMYHSRGTIQSRIDTRHAWLAYAVNSQQGSGRVEVRTSDHALVIEVVGRAARIAAVAVDGRPMGSVHIGASSEILDSSGERLGLVSGGSPAATHRAVNYKDVELNGRLVAQFNTNLLRPLQRPGRPPAAFVVHVAELSDSEGWWLLALLALELYHDRNRLWP